MSLQSLYHLEEEGFEVWISLHLSPLVSLLTLSMETDMGEMMEFGMHLFHPHRSSQGAPEEPRPLPHCLLKQICSYQLQLSW